MAATRVLLRKSPFRAKIPQKHSIQSMNLAWNYGKMHKGRIKIKEQLRNIVKEIMITRTKVLKNANRLWHNEGKDIKDDVTMIKMESGNKRQKVEEKRWRSCTFFSLVDHQHCNWDGPRSHFHRRRWKPLNPLSASRWSGVLAAGRGGNSFHILFWSPKSMDTSMTFSF